ncbi:hypothetical protein Tco_1345368 [Tanacetum coccineum]
MIIFNYYLSQYEKLVNASRAKKIRKSHDPLALVAHTGSSSRTSSPYYVTHPSSVIDFDDDYQRDAFQNNSEDPLTSAMMLLARAITQSFSNPTNNCLRTSSNTINQAIVQADRVNIQSINSGNDGRSTRRSFVPEEIIKVRKDKAGVTLTDEQNDFLVADANRMEEIEELNNQEQKYPKQPKIINDTIGDDQIDSNIIFDEPNVVINSGSVEYDNNVQASYGLEQLSRNAYKEAEKQQIIANKVKQENKVLIQQLELYKKKVRVFEMTKGNNTNFFNEFIKADSKARRLEKDLQTQFIRDRDVIRDLEQKQDNLQLDTEDILDDSTKSQKKMENKLKDPIAIEKKQNVHTFDYNKLNDLYEDFVPQKELSAKQKHFSSTFIPSENPSNARTSTSPSETKLQCLVQK